MSAALKETPGKMVVELRNVKYSASLSEETNAFTAMLYFDGKKVGTASNHGTGGANDVHIFNHEDRRRFLELIAAEPPYKDNHGDLKMDEDLYISVLVEKYLVEKDRLKNEKRFEKKAAQARLSGSVLLVVHFEGSFVEGICKPDEVDSLAARINKQYGKGAVGKVRVIS